MSLDLAHHCQAVNDMFSLSSGDGTHLDDLLLLILSRSGDFLLVFIALVVIVVCRFVAVFLGFG